MRCCGTRGITSKDLVSRCIHCGFQGRWRTGRHHHPLQQQQTSRPSSSNISSAGGCDQVQSVAHTEHRPCIWKGNSCAEEGGPLCGGRKAKRWRNGAAAVSFFLPFFNKCVLSYRRFFLQMRRTRWFTRAQRCARVLVKSIGTAQDPHTESIPCLGGCAFVAAGALRPPFDRPPADDRQHCALDRTGVEWIGVWVPTGLFDWPRGCGQRLIVFKHSFLPSFLPCMHRRTGSY